MSIESTAPTPATAPVTPTAEAPAPVTPPAPASVTLPAPARAVAGKRNYGRAFGIAALALAGSVILWGAILALAAAIVLPLAVWWALYSDFG